MESFVTACPNVNERCHAIESLGDWAEDDDDVETWLKIHPGPHSLLANGIYKAKWAWAARGTSVASRVNATAWETFHQRLDVAKSFLLEAMKRDPSEAIPVPWLIWMALGLGDDDLLQRSFVEGVRRQPTLRAIYAAMIIAKSVRWGGSPGDQLDFVREWAPKAPSSSGVAALIVLAHDMTWEDGDLSNNAKAYWLQSSVVSEIVLADETCRSLPLEGTHGTYIRQFLAYGLWRCGQFSLAKPHFQAIGNGFNERPWFRFKRGFNWLLGPLRKARRECLRT
ncbi:MAG: hypothetical protein IBJ18_00250 [Phycisphaerales bacterium]|nr:hypothetical protein [Phycisphaerales bacterium]